jgi:error-prone DNA polymerase
VDIESDRREEAIQYVYDHHGRRNAAQVANVITYRATSVSCWRDSASLSEAIAATHLGCVSK